MAARIRAFLNEKAGSADQREARRVETLIETLSREPAVEQVETLDPGALEAALKQAVASGVERVIVGGGDGTLNTAAGILADTETTLGILPMGTLNHFARDAGIPSDLEEAAAIALTGQPRFVDLGEANGRIFLNTCSMGGYVTALRRRERLRRRASHGKARAMFWGTLAALRRVPRIHATLTSPERTLTLRASFVLVSNNPYTDDGLTSGRRTRLDGGTLGVYTSRAHRYRDLFRTLVELWRSGVKGATQLECWETAQLEVSTSDHALHIAMDGEVVRLRMPLGLRCRARALCIAAPPAAG